VRVEMMPTGRLILFSGEMKVMPLTASLPPIFNENKPSSRRNDG
jgi:hypothetical protein